MRSSLAKLVVGVAVVAGAACGDISPPNRSADFYDWRLNTGGQALTFNWPQSSLPVRIWVEDSLGLPGHPPDEFVVAVRCKIPPIESAAHLVRGREHDGAVHLFDRPARLDQVGCQPIEQLRGAPRRFSSTHLPRKTGDVRVGYDVTIKMLPCVKMPPRSVPASETRRK